ncbi:MAG TPA: polysaccharide biosynthesis/export family protein [Longimicrobium sp.]|nr:polysaccharide biosynthesis/export family protein [Longimicrobium sp.]
MNSFLTMAWRWVAPLVLLMACALPASAQTSAPASQVVSLGPGDVVKLVIWREEDLSGEFTVDANGVVTLPKIGEQRVAGIPVDQLRAQLVERFRAFLRNPSIVVIPLRRVQVLGEVRKPGLYTVDPTVTLAGAVALAEGATPDGDLGSIRIVRDGQLVTGRVTPGSTLSGVDIRSGDQIFVGKRSWISRNSPVLFGALLSVLTTAVAVILTRPS